MAALDALLVACAAFFAVRGLLGTLATRRLRTLAGLALVRQAGSAPSAEPLDLPFGDRVLRPALGIAGRALGRLLPERLLAETTAALQRAGMATIRPADWLAGRVLLAMALAGYVLLVLHGQTFAPLAALAALPLGWSLPHLYLRSRETRRANAIRDDLPDALDLLTVCVEAGLGFDQALLRVVERFPGPLGAEFGRVLRDQRLGTTRREALSGMTQRCGLAELAVFVHAIVQAEELGVRIGTVLRVQSDTMREKRRQRAEELAMKAPIKMAFPMIFLILPALFLVVLGPALIQAFSALRGR